MGMAAILVMWPEPFEQTFVPPSQGGSIWNLASIGPVVSEEKMFENVDIHTYIHTYIHTCIHTYIHTHDRACLYYKLTYEPKGSGASFMKYRFKRKILWYGVTVNFSLKEELTPKFLLSCFVKWAPAELKKIQVIELSKLPLLWTLLIN